MTRREDLLSPLTSDHAPTSAKDVGPVDSKFIRVGIHVLNCVLECLRKHCDPTIVSINFAALVDRVNRERCLAEYEEGNTGTDVFACVLPVSTLLIKTLLLRSPSGRRCIPSVKCNSVSTP